MDNNSVENSPVDNNNSYSPRGIKVVNAVVGASLLGSAIAGCSRVVNSSDVEGTEGDSNPGVSEQINEVDEQEETVEPYTEDGSVVPNTPTVTPTQTQEATATPTEIIYNPFSYDSWKEQAEFFGYDLCTTYRMTEGSSYDWKDGITVFSTFVYEGYERSSDTFTISGIMTVKGEEYPIRFFLDKGISRYYAGSSSHTMDKEIIEKYLKRGRNYYFFAFPMLKETSEIIPPRNREEEDFRDYNEEEWKEIREIIDGLVKNNGEFGDYILSLRSLELVR